MPIKIDQKSFPGIQKQLSKATGGLPVVKTNEFLKDSDLRQMYPNDIAFIHGKMWLRLPLQDKQCYLMTYGGYQSESLLINFTNQFIPDQRVILSQFATVLAASIQDVLLTTYDKFMTDKFIPMITGSDGATPEEELTSITLGEFIKEMVSQASSAAGAPIATVQLGDPFQAMWNAIATLAKMNLDDLTASKPGYDIMSAKDKLGLVDFPFTKGSAAEQFLNMVANQKDNTTRNNIYALRDITTDIDPEVELASVFTHDASYIDDGDIQTVLAEAEKSRAGVFSPADPKIEEKIMRAIAGQNSGVKGLAPVLVALNKKNSRFGNQLDTDFEKLAQTDFRDMLKKMGRIMGVKTPKIPRLYQS